MVADRKRIMIIGQPGSGKSTLARELGNVLDLPVIHIDHIHWQSGWIERAGPEKDRLCAEVHSKEKWIFEGGRSNTWLERLNRADTLIWLDLPISIRSWRVFWRTLQNHGKSRVDLPEECPEHFNWVFTQFIWRTRKTSRLKMLQLFDSAPIEKEKYQLRSRSEVNDLLRLVDGW